MKNIAALGIILVLALASPCAGLDDSDLDGGFNGGFNGTIYYLSKDKVVADKPVVGSIFNLTLYQKAENITFLDEKGEPVGFNESSDFWRGRHTYHIAFDRNVTGNLTYELASQQAQHFVVPSKSVEPVRVILPPGYTTGNRILGIPRPDPDQIVVEGNNTVLIWKSSNKDRVVEVGFYKEGALRSLKFIILLLGFLAAILGIEHYFSMKRLKSMEEEKHR